jgi:hypothetical protein
MEIKDVLVGTRAMLDPRITDCATFSCMAYLNFTLSHINFVLPYLSHRSVPP